MSMTSSETTYNEKRKHLHGVQESGLLMVQNQSVIRLYYEVDHDIVHATTIIFKDQM